MCIWIEKECVLLLVSSMLMNEISSRWLNNKEFEIKRLILFMISGSSPVVVNIMDTGSLYSR
jgi:hypothetical protein